MASHPVMFGGATWLDRLFGRNRPTIPYPQSAIVITCRQCGTRLVAKAGALWPDLYDGAWDLFPPCPVEAR